MPRQTQRLPGPDDWAARRVRDERERRGWSTAEVARRVTEAGCPISQSSVWDIENRKPPRRISVGEAVALARIFDISIEELVQPPRAAVDQLSELRAELGLAGRNALAALDELENLTKREVEIMLRSDLAPEIKDAGVEAARHIANIRARADEALAAVRRLTAGMPLGKPKIIVYSAERAWLKNALEELSSDRLRWHDMFLKAYETTRSAPAEQRASTLAAAAEEFLRESAE